MAYLPAGEYALLLPSCVAHRSDRGRAARASTRTWRPVPMPRDGYRPRYRRGTARTGAAVVLALGATLLAGCGADEGPPTLTWYINPDAGGQAAIAEKCTQAAGGEYRIETSLLPNDAASQREQLARRLAAGDSSLDIMSLDPPFVPELAAPGFLAPVPAATAQRTTQNVVEGALTGARWK